MTAKILYTLTDEAPALATRSLLPIIQAFAEPAGVEVETRDISLVGRILAAFPDMLDEPVHDALTELGELAHDPDANIIKLPNISASIPQLEAAVAELRDKGHDLPAYPDQPSSPEELEIRVRYDSVKGSAVNPVLRQGNSDRRAPAAVKHFAQKHPHSMGEWSSDSKTHVATMSSGDFRSNERSVTIEQAGDLRIELVDRDGGVMVLKDPIPVEDGEVVDATLMSKTALVDFLDAQIADANERGVLFSLHMKATMMKVSDPIIFGHAVRRYFRELFDLHALALEQAGADPKDGLASVLADIAALPEAEQQAIRQAIASAYATGPQLAMVDSDRGITNLHVPSDIIIDASMPAMIRNSGKWWGPDGDEQDTKATIPDSSYAAVYAETIADCKANGAFDPATMGTTPNVGLMAMQAEEYGSHDKTFEIRTPGTVRVVDSAGTTLLEHDVEVGDIWRACQVKDAAVRDWVGLAVRRARSTGWPAVFWLDAGRAHDAQLIGKVERYLEDHDTDGLEIHIMSVPEATRFTLQRARAGQNTITVTGNVLRDYLTDLFPILELGTSAKVLSIVPLMSGGGLFETGAGGSAPKHVQQFQRENHLRWDSLGEFLALTVSLEHLAEQNDNPKAKVLADALDKAVEGYLEHGRSPSRRVGELDNRGSHFYLALYWAQALAEQTTDQELRERFAPLAETLADHEAQIVEELGAVQGQPVDLGGYYLPDEDKVRAAMRPSATFNADLEAFAAG